MDLPDSFQRSSTAELTHPLSRRSSWFAWGALFITVWAIIFLRAPEMVLAPPLLYDEGPKVFANFYEHRELAQLVRFKAGYIPLIANIIGYAAVRMPTRAIPYVFVGSAVLITTITCCLFFARWFRAWFPADLERWLICVMFALAPIANCLLITTVDYSLWNLLVALILVTVCRPPQTRGWRYLHAFVCNLLVWAHPLAIVIAPLVIWRLLKEERNRDVYLLLFCNLLLHQLFGVAGILTMRGLWQGHASASLAPGNFLDACVWTGQIIATTAFRTAFGPAMLNWALHAQPLLVVIWLVTLAASLFLVARSVPRTRPVIAYTGYLIVTVTFLCCFLRYNYVHRDPIGFVSYASRYIYVQSLCFLLLFATLLSGVAELVCKHTRLKSREVIGRTSSWAASVLLLALVCHYFILNTRFGYFVKSSERGGPYYDSDRRNGTVVRQFFSRLAEMEQERGSYKGIQLTARKVNDWSFRVDTLTPKRAAYFRVKWRELPIAVILALVPLAYKSRGTWIRWDEKRLG
jgi:hypothetical protein